MQKNSDKIENIQKKSDIEDIYIYIYIIYAYKYIYNKFEVKLKT